jgi:hypothetical protein
MRTSLLLTAAASILLAISGPSLAASRTQAHRSIDAYSAYARDTDNAFWAAPYVYAPRREAPYGSTYGFQGRNTVNTFATSRDPSLPYEPYRERNDW